MTAADVGEAEQLGCGQVLREGISPNRQLRLKCLLWRKGAREGEGEGEGEGGWGAGFEIGVPRSPSAPPVHRLQTNHPRMIFFADTKSISLMTPEVPRVGGTSFIQPFR